jgi:hypothetical protein
VRFLLLLLLTVVRVGAADTCSIAGIVVQQGARVRHARVTVSPLDGQRIEVAAATGNEGQFSFTGLAAGKYRLAAEVRGHRQFYQEHEGFSTSIALGPGLDSEHIVVAMDGVAMLHGTVRDEAGDPVANMYISLFQRAIDMGRAKIKVVPEEAGILTDAAGEFHVRNLKPGIYFVAAQGRPWFARYQPRSLNPEPDPLDVAYPLTYYADSTNPAEATPITLTEGATSEVHLTLRATPALHISFEGGDMSDAPQLTQEGLGGIELSVWGTQLYSSPDLRELSGLTPGRYFMRWQKQNLGRTAISFSHDTGVNVDELSKSVATAISGTVTLTDGVTAHDAVVWLENVASDNGGGLARSVAAANGEFSFDARRGGNTPPGRYELRLSDGLYIKSVAVKGAAYSRGELEVREGSQIQMSITAGKAGDFEGVVTKDGQPFGGAMVLLIPQDFSHGAAIPRDQSDSDGTFKMTSVAPGAYTLLAIEEPGELAYHDPAATAPYLKQGRTLQLPLAPGTQTKVEVQRQIP